MGRITYDKIKQRRKDDDTALVVEINRLQEQGRPLKEIAKLVGLKSKQSVWYYLNKNHVFMEGKVK